MATRCASPGCPPPAPRRRSPRPRSCCGEGRRDLGNGFVLKLTVKGQAKRAFRIAAACAAAVGFLPGIAAATTTEVGVVGKAPKAEQRTKSLEGGTPGGTSARASVAGECLVISRTSGFQTAVDGIRNPDVIPREGRIVAWTITLGDPTTADVRYFNEHEGGPAEAELGILEPVYPKPKKPNKKQKRVKRSTRRGRAAATGTSRGRTKKRKSEAKRKQQPEATHYRLVAATPLVRLEPYFGMTAQFALETTIPVKKGDLIVLTSPTWAPALAIGESKNTTWRASRSKTKCANTSEPTAHIHVGVVREYGCQYVEARLTYSALLVSTP